MFGAARPRAVEAASRATYTRAALREREGDVVGRDRDADDAQRRRSRPTSQRVADREVPLAREPALDHDLAGAPREVAARRRSRSRGGRRARRATAPLRGRAWPSARSATLVRSRRYERAARFGSARTRASTVVARLGGRSARSRRAGRPARRRGRSRWPARSRPSSRCRPPATRRARRARRAACARGARAGRRARRAITRHQPPVAQRAARGRRSPAAAASCVTSTTARPSSAPRAQQPQHLGAGLDVEVAGRLVGQQRAPGR